MKRRIADWLVALALRLYPAAAAFPDPDGPVTTEGWTMLILLHSEAVHGCEHMDRARRELGLAGPRAEAAP